MQYNKFDIFRHSQALSYVKSRPDILRSVGDFGVGDVYLIGSSVQKFTVVISCTLYRVVCGTLHPLPLSLHRHSVYLSEGFL